MKNLQFFEEKVTSFLEGFWSIFGEKSRFFDWSRLDRGCGDWKICLGFLEFAFCDFWDQWAQIWVLFENLPFFAIFHGSMCWALWRDFLKFNLIFLHLQFSDGDRGSLFGFFLFFRVLTPTRIGQIWTFEHYFFSVLSLPLKVSVFPTSESHIFGSFFMVFVYFSKMRKSQTLWRPRELDNLGYSRRISLNDFPRKNVLLD